MLGGLLGGGPSWAEDEPPADDDAEAESGPVITMGGRVMTGFEHEISKPAPPQGTFREEATGFFLQQARLKLDAELDERFSAELSLDLSDGLSPKISAFDMNRPQYVRDAYLDARFARALRLRVGHFKRPFSRLALTSSGKLPLRGRGLLDGVLIEDGRFGDRALGAMLWGRFKRPDLEWNLAVMNPNWAPTTRNDGYDLIGRVEYAPTRWLSIGLNGARKSLDLGTRHATGHGVGGDLHFRFLDASVQLEGSYGDLVFDPERPAAFGGHVLATYDVSLTPLLVLQPALFVEYADAHSVFLQSEAVRIALGLNAIHHDTFRVMPQVAVTRPVGDASEFNPWVEQYEYTLMLSFAF